MIFTFAGTGSAFALSNYQSNVLIRSDENTDRYLLIDAGSDIRFALNDLGLSYKNIDSLYITHAHADHIGGVEYLAFCSYFDPAYRKKIKIIGNGDLLYRIWCNSLRGGLESIQGDVMELEDYFQVEKIRSNQSFHWSSYQTNDMSFQTVQSVHVMNGYALVPSYGLMITSPDTGKKVFFTGDTQFNPNQIIDFYKTAEIIIQDCETTPYRSGVHANYEELKTLPADIKKKMLLLHYQDNVVKDFDTWQTKAKTDGFLGFLKKGSSLTVK